MNEKWVDRTGRGFIGRLRSTKCVEGLRKEGMLGFKVGNCGVSFFCADFSTVDLVLLPTDFFGSAIVLAVATALAVIFFLAFGFTADLRTIFFLTAALAVVFFFAVTFFVTFVFAFGLTAFDLATVFFFAVVFGLATFFAFVFLTAMVHFLYFLKTPSASGQA